MKGPALVVMARAPAPGLTKTRLQPGLTREQCAAVSEAFLRDTIDLAISLPQYTPFLAFTPEGERKLFENFAPRGMEIMVQTGVDLGQRMYRLMCYLEAMKYSPVVLIGCDIPALQPAVLLKAIDVLRNADVCLGPSQDGGYYLVGARRTDDCVFVGIPWGTAEVMKLTMRKAKEAGLSLALLEEYADVDTFEDLKRLCLDIERLRSIHGARVPLHTEAWLKENGFYLSSVNAGHGL